MNTLNHIQRKFKLNFDQKQPVEIPDYGRDGLAELFAELGFRTIVEVGVCAGEYSEVLCRANPKATIYGVDPFMPYSEYGDYQRQSSIDKYHDRARGVSERFPNHHLIEKMSVEGAKDFDDGSLDAVYIDANHRFEYVTADIHAWLPKIRKGGIISGHDYAKIRPPTNTHVYQVINGYTESRLIRPWFVLGSNAMIPGQVRDLMRSWMWVV